MLHVLKLCVCKVSSVASDSVQHYGLQTARLSSLCDSPGKNTGVGCQALLPRIKSVSLAFPALAAGPLPLASPGKPILLYILL